MGIKVKSSEEIAKMRVAGRLAAQVLEMIGQYVQPGVSTEELNQICHKYIVDELKAIPAPLNYWPSKEDFDKPFPKSICTSVNEVICHGIPSSSQKLKNSDIINIDVTVIKDGYHGDTSKMFFVGKPSNPQRDSTAKKLIKVTQECLYSGIRQVKPGNTLVDIAKVIEEHAVAHKFSVVQEYCGHGIGAKFHEEPQVLHYVDTKLRDQLQNIVLQPGMIFTIEPMINAGKRGIKKKDGQWPVETADGKLSAQWEHTILVTDNGYEVLTKRVEEQDLI